MSTPIRVLVLEDRVTDAELIIRELRRAGFDPQWKRVETEAAFLAELENSPELILSDYAMPNFDGLRAAEVLHERKLDIPFILVSGTIGEDIAVEAMKRGATDYLIKDRTARLGAAVERALREKRLRTERRRAEEELRHTHDQLQRLLAHSPAVIYSLTVADGRVLHQLVSENITRLLGFTAAESCASDWWVNRLHTEDRAQALASVTRSGPDGRATIEYRLQHKDGRFVWVEDSLRTVGNGNGDPVEVAGVWTDITERKLAQEKLSYYTASLERSNRELQDFASVASHDLQEPLRKIQAFCDRLKARSGTALDETARDYLDRMQNAAARMQTLVNDLLAFSRITTRAQPFVACDLAEIAREVMGDLETRLEQTAGRVELGELPTIEVDPTQMRQLFQNLIANALKFHQPGQSPVVKVFCERDGSLIRLHVADNGIGFDEKYLDRIFTIFQRLHGRQEYEGTGVGLAVCRKIAIRHGGSITARSQPGQGATFIVTLPCKQTNGTETAQR